MWFTSWPEDSYTSSNVVSIDSMDAECTRLLYFAVTTVVSHAASLRALVQSSKLRAA